MPLPRKGIWRLAQEAEARHRSSRTKARYVDYANSYYNLDPFAGSSTFQWRGAWTSVASYVVGDLVTYDDGTTVSTWRALADNTNVEPEEGATWTILAQGGSPGGVSTIDHGTLSGLGDDDHTQYYNQARGDARYERIANKNQASGYLGLESNSKPLPSNLGTGTPTGLKFLAGDGTWKENAAASETTAGIARIATQGEADGHVDDARIMTPLKTYTMTEARYAIKARAINAGTGLSGGGDLSADRTISLTNTGVAAGSYTNTDLTVNAQGRITAVASGTGGGGEATAYPLPLFSGAGDLVVNEDGEPIFVFVNSEDIV